METTECIMLTYPYIVGVLTLLVLWKLKFMFFKREPGTGAGSTLPPGPNALEVFLNIWELKSKPHLTITKWAQKYGDIFSFSAMFKTVIVVSNPEMVRKLFRLESTAARLTEHPIFSALNQNGHGVVHSEGRLWREQRQFLIRKLHIFMSTILQESTVNEANKLAANLETKAGIPWDCIQDLTVAVGNTFWKLCFNKDASDTEDMDKRSAITGRLLHNFQHVTTSVLLMVPSLRLIAPGFTGWRKYVNAIKDMETLIGQYLKEHLDTFEENYLRDLADYFILEIQQTSDPCSSFYREQGETNITVTLLELLVAANETTSYSLTWAMLYLSHYQDAQQKFKLEIDRVMGNEPASLRHKANMPYTKALISEILRKSSVAPLGVPHCMREDAVFETWKFPKGAHLFANIFAIQKSSDLWGDPESFRPGRFISEDGTTYINHKGLIPFGEGKRKCIGAVHARDTLFIFLTTLFQRFHVVPENPANKPNFLPRKGSLLLPEPFKIILLKRKL